MLKIKTKLLNALSVLLLKKLGLRLFRQVYFQNYGQKHFQQHATSQTDYLSRLCKKKRHFKFGINKIPDISNLQIYGYDTYIVNYRNKAKKMDLAYEPVFLLTIKQKINR